MGRCPGRSRARLEAWRNSRGKCSSPISDGQIVDTSCQLPSNSPSSLVHSYSSLLLSHFIHPIPSLPLNFALPSTSGLVANSISKPVFSQTWNAQDAPGALRGAVLTLVRSALGGRGTALVQSRCKENKRGGPEKDVAERMARELRKWGGEDQWGGQLVGPRGLTSSEEDGSKVVPVAGQPKEGEVMVWAWVGKKQ
jgi:hypothetical protein